ncbi:hypothetical protein M8J77_021719 [Diaphorina citri]|nr:hypothetical protein M8J77_021719 [Diaphorina citri]
MQTQEYVERKNSTMKEQRKDEAINGKDNEEEKEEEEEEKKYGGGGGGVLILRKATENLLRPLLSAHERLYWCGFINEKKYFKSGSSPKQRALSQHKLTGRGVTEHSLK